jgi:iron complex outermembrane receptor protein
VANLALRPLAGTVVNLSKPLHRYGVTLNLTKEVVAYALESTTVLPPGTGRTITGGFLPPQEGKGREAGLKVAAFGGRVSATVSVFKQELTNQSVFAGVDANGISYAAPIGSTTQKGWDMDLSLKPLPNWQIIGTFFHGEVYDQTGNPVANTYDQSLSLFTRYDFVDGPLKNFALGGGVARISGRKVTSAGIVFPAGMTAPALIDVEPGTWVDLFVNYRLDRHWSFRVACANVLDEAYAMGAQTAYFVDPSPPRTFTFATMYKF